MPVRIYDIAKRLGLSNKVVLEKAKELGIAAARAASCSLDKITAEFLEQQFQKSEPAQEVSVETKKSESPLPPVKEEAPQKLEEASAKSPVAPAAPAPAETKPEPFVQPETPKDLAEQTQVPDSVLKEVENFVQQGLEELSAEGDDESNRGGKFSKGAKRDSAQKRPGEHPKKVETKEVKPLKEEAKPEKVVTPPAPKSEPAVQSQPTVATPVAAPVSLPQSEPKKEVEPAVAAEPSKVKAPVVPPAKVTPPASQAATPAAPKQAPAALAAAPAPAKPAPVFGLKPIWKIPLSAIGKRLADEKAASEAAESAKKTVAQEPEKPAEEAKLGQKIGFIQLPQKPVPAAKQPDKQANAKGRDKRGDRGGKDKPQNRPAQGQPQGQGQQGQQRGGFQQRPGQQQFQRSGGNFQNRQQQGRQQQGGRDSQKNAAPRDKRADRAQQPAAPVRRDVPSKVPANAEVITMKAPVVVRQLAELLHRKPFQLIADLMEQGVFANVNQSIDETAASKLCAKHGFRFELEKREKGGALVKGDQKKVEIIEEEDDPSQMVSRPPVVTIMGHVDHGKTTLLDAIRKSHVASGEAGGITQHIGAYTISIPHPERKNELQQITFLDTPGHEAFSAMRARGANVTDIVILVVAANDGLMPQTIEAIRHAQAAKVTIMVAVNKCDLPGANALKVRQQLQDYGLLCEEWGGSTIFVDVSALTKQGIDNLLGLLVLQAEVLELKANPKRRAKGNVVESGLAPGGPTATVLVRKGTLKLGDSILCGEFYGKARALINEEGQRLKKAAPSEAVKLLGLNGVPEAGTEFQVVENDKIARDMAEEQRERNRQEGNRDRERPVTLEGFLENFGSDTAKSLKIVVKGDTQGSVEAIVDALKKIESEKVSLEIIHSAVGTVTESDVILASASKAVIVGFHTRVDNSALDAARREGVQIKLYSIIYELIDQVRDAMAGLLDPIINEVPQGQAEVRQVFNLSKAGSVAGCMVTQGRVIKGRCRVLRGKEVVFEGSFQSLRRFQDEVNELKAGMECGIRIDGFHDYREGDVIHSYSIEKIAQQL